jgi:uncharacterized membrane-anchored protein
VRGPGYLGPAVFAIVFAVPALGYWLLRRGPVLPFWAAYVVTRPLGASVADWMGVSPARGGLGFGTGLITVVWAAAIAGSSDGRAPLGPDQPRVRLVPVPAPL